MSTQYACLSCGAPNEDRVLCSCGGVIDRPCPYCGESVEVDLFEVWEDDRAFMLSTCCEALHDGLIRELNDALELSPLERARFLKPLRNLFAQWGIPLRLLYAPRPFDNLRIDFGLQLPSQQPNRVGDQLAPVSYAEAMAFIQEHHAHNEKLPGWKWGHALHNGADLIGVAVVGTPRAKGLCRNKLQPYFPIILEVNRVCVRRDLDPILTWNACSKLYALCVQEAARRNQVEHAKGRSRHDLIQRLITYTLQSETGTTLKAAGWDLDHATEGRSWDTPSRRRQDTAPTEDKWRWTRWLLPREQTEIFDMRTATSAAA